MITLAFLFLFCICILCCFLTQKSTLSDAFFGVFWIRYGAIFWCCRFPRVTRRGSSSGGGQICQNAEIPLVSCRYSCIFCKRMHLQYIEAFLVCNTGALPQTPASLVAPQGQAVKTQPPDPVAKCWVGSKASRVKCTASPPLTPLHLRESSKTIRSGWSWKPVKACEATACGLAFTGWRRPNASVVRVQEVFPCTPATWRTRVWAAPTVLARPLGVAQ